jgi:hypothetical protein
MSIAEKNCLKAKYSSRTNTSAHETGAPQEKQFDFSNFNSFFTSIIEPERAVAYLEELRTEYLEVSLHISIENTSREIILFRDVHDNVQRHSWLISELIKLFKSTFNQQNQQS